MFMMLLAVAGNETTRNATAHGMYALLTNPEQFELLEERPRRAASTTRSRRSCAGRRRCCTSAAPRPPTPRSAVGRSRPGDRVVIWHISANRDEEVWDDPFVFDITRNPNPHVAFGGGGSHFCLGANLARMELKLILVRARHADARHAAGG